MFTLDGLNLIRDAFKFLAVYKTVKSLYTEGNSAFYNLKNLIDMEERMGFFTSDKNNGITVTRSQQIKSLAAELSKTEKRKIESMVPYGCTIQIVGGEPSQMGIGVTPAQFAMIKTLQKRIGDLDAFCAYLGEARKEREKITDRIVNMSIDEWLKKTGQENPKCLSLEEWLVENGKCFRVQQLEMPKIPDARKDDADKLIDQLTDEQYVEYMDLNSRAAVLGNLVNKPDAPLVKFREEFYKASTNPIVVSECGRDTTIKKKELSLTEEELNATFMELQSIYRNIQARINKIRYDLLENENKRFQRENAEYQEAYSAYSKERTEVENHNKIILKEYDEYKLGIQEQRSILSSKFRADQSEELNKFSSLRIAIAPRYMSIYKEVDQLGKTE